MSSYIGMPPSGYAKPLEMAQNLNDVPDKAAALLNLGAASAEDVLRAANPIGTIIAFYGSTAPSGYLPCSGQSVSNTIFPELVEFLNPGNSSATLPDLRGEFLRGWDNGRGIDLGRAIKTAQLDELKSHGHDLSNGGRAMTTGGTGNSLTGPAGGSAINPSVSILPTGGAETRPRNIAVLYCIKAYGVIVNQGSVDVAAIAAQTDLKVALTQFTGTNQSLATNGYQKLPGGLIIQWGTTTSASVLFPIAFPTQNLKVVMQVTGFNSSLAFAGQYFAIVTRTTSGFTLGTASPYTMEWIAIGY